MNSLLIAPPALLELAPGFSLANARACITASLDAYNSPGSRVQSPESDKVCDKACDEVSGEEHWIQTALAHCLIRKVNAGSGASATIVAFRGTASARDFVSDAEFWRNPLAGFEVHHGFREAYASVIRLLEKWEGWAVDPNEVWPIIVTGHSLGGALAMLCAWALERAGFPVHSVYTFGQPRVGNGAFARDYNARFIPDKPSLGERTWRCVNQEDLVPRLPGVLMGYRHAGREVFFPALGSMVMDPPLWFKLVSDAIGLWLRYRQRRLLMLCHPAREYKKQLERRMPSPDLAHE